MSQLFNLLFLIYSWYIAFRKQFLNLFGPIKIIYAYNTKNKNYYNINILYWLNYIELLHTDSTIYHMIIYQKDSTYHLLHSDHRIFQNFNFDYKNLDKRIKRKNIMLLDSKKDVIQYDLNFLDNYYLMTKRYDCITDLQTIFDIFRIKCAYVQIMSFKPIKKEIIPINNTTLDLLYDN